MFWLRKAGRGAGWVAGVLLSLAWQSPAATADTVIDLTPGNTLINAWGPTSTLQYGQVITVPTVDTVLDSFSFTFNATGMFNFNADVAAWSGTQATGSLLYSSSQTTTDVGSDHTYLINTGSLALTAGAQYVLFFDAAGGSGTGSGIMSARDHNPYSGGGFVYSNNATASLTTGPWDSSLGSQGYDAAFVAHFSAVPLPSTFWGSCTLLAGIGIFTTIRRRLASAHAFG